MYHLLIAIVFVEMGVKNFQTGKKRGLSKWDNSNVKQTKQNCDRSGGNIEEANIGARTRNRKAGGAVAMMYRFTHAHP